MEEKKYLKSGGLICAEATNPELTYFHSTLSVIVSEALKVCISCLG